LALVVPGAERRWRLVRRAGMSLLRICGVGVTVEGAHRLPKRTPYVLTANHASYLDPLIIMIAVPSPIVFATLPGLADNPFVAVFLRRMGAQLVGGGERRRAATATRALEDAVRAGAVVAFFPEGRRSPARGLEPFRMGAFIVAANTHVPVVPLAIRGTRRLLPADRTLPRRSDVHIIVAPPVTTAGAGWSGAVELQHATRTIILQHLDEPDLA
jgi:1-acyl-sn-glycerol-3-phosphate acyltransferase